MSDIIDVDALSLGDDDRLNIEDLRREIDVQLGTIEEGLNELELIEKPNENDDVLRKQALESMRRNRAAKGAAKQEKQRALKAKQLIQEKQAARRQSRGGNSSWGIRMMENMGIEDIRPMLEARKRQRELNENDEMRQQLLQWAQHPDVVIVNNRAWRYKKTATTERWTLLSGH